MCSLLFSPAALAQSAPSPALPVVVSNDNRTPAGALKNNILELRLELRQARWYPEEEGGPHRDVYVFAEEGRAPQSPGPLIRLPQGTQIHASIRNTLPLAAKIYGLHSHPGDANEALVLAAGELRELRFMSGDPGTYMYWATTADHSLDSRADAETMLSGAFVVDPPGAKPDDRIFVLSTWTTGDTLETIQIIASVNGKSWPYDEHFTYPAGETVHWRVINPSASQHAMHLHGFYFDVIAAGDGEHYERYAEGLQRKGVTEMIDMGHAFEMTWMPDRPGNWLFHCHMVEHMSQSEALHPPAAQPASYSPDHDHGAMMGGLVIGVTVLPSSKSATVPVAAAAAHKLQLVISNNPGKIPLYALEVKDPRAPAPPASAADAPPKLLGPPIVLTRGETTEIEVKNETAGPTAIHWHGMELESFYDGVPGWTGTNEKLTPSIPPGGYFIARMTPPRAGTFIYHTHWHDSAQILNGVYGALIVLEPGEKYDPEHDRTFVFSIGKYAPFGYLLLINGNPQPDLIELQAGTRYRFRLVNISDNGVDLRVRLGTLDAAEQWKVIAKDGAALPAAQVKTSKAEMGVTVGETYDVEYESKTQSLISLQVWLEAFPAPAAVPLRFSAPQ